MRYEYQKNSVSLYMPAPETQMVLDEECKKGAHPFKILLSIEGDQQSIVARWCDICGTAAIDRNDDNRTQAGVFMRATRPKIFEQNL